MEKQEALEQSFITGHTQNLSSQVEKGITSVIISPVPERFSIPLSGFVDEGYISIETVTEENLWVELLMAHFSRWDDESEWEKFGESKISVAEQQAWEESRRIVAELEAQKARDILAEQNMSEEERNRLRQEKKDREREEFEQSKSIAIIRYQEIQGAINVLESTSAERGLTEEERIILINLRDEALDLSLRYEMFRTITPEEHLQSAISTLADQSFLIQYYNELLSSCKSESEANSIKHDIYLFESYVTLAEDAQKQWDAGASVEYILDYIDSRINEIFLEAAKLFLST